MLACLSTVLAGSRLDRQVFRRLKIGRKMSVTTATLTTGFMVLGLVGFGVLYAAGIGSMSKFANAESVRFMALVFFGILPVRIGAIIFSRSSRFNKVFGVLVVMGFFLTETGFITL